MAENPFDRIPRRTGPIEGGMRRDPTGHGIVGEPGPGFANMADRMAHERLQAAYEYVDKMQARFSDWRASKGMSDEETLAQRERRARQIALRWEELGLGIDDLDRIGDLSAEEAALNASSGSRAFHARARRTGLESMATDYERLYFYHGGV